MKKFKYLIVIIIAFFTIGLNCNASTRTYTRTTDNLLIPNDVKIDSNNIQDILKTPAVSAVEKIYDFANLIDDNDEGKLVEEITAFNKKANMDIVIVTTNDLKGFQMPEYTYNFYDYNDFLTDGVTLVIYTGGNKPEIFMGNSGKEDSFIFTTYNETRINKTLAYIYNGKISDGKYYEACDEYIDIIKGFYASDMGIDVDGGGIAWVEIIILSLALAFIANILFVFRLGKYKVTSKKVEVMDKRVNNSTLVIEQIQDTPSTGNSN